MVQSQTDAFESPLCAICRVRETEGFRWGDFHLNLHPPLQISRCCRCGLLFMSPRPARDMRFSLMRGVVPVSLQVYTDMPADYTTNSASERRRKVFERRLDRLGEILQINKNGMIPNLLDVGASSGTFVHLARSLGWKAEGIEPSLSGIQSAVANGLALTRGLAESLPYESDAFDIIHSHHVLEHLADPGFAMAEFHRVLKPGGLVFVEVPNQFDNISFFRDKILRRISQRKRDIYSIHHLWFFSRSTLPMLLRSAGFKNIRVEDFYLAPIRGWRAPFIILTRMAGIFVYGGSLLRAYGWK